MLVFIHSPQWVYVPKCSFTINTVLFCFRHNAERFSKLAFGSGKYKNEEMKDLDITKIRDFATFMALTPNHQGKGGEAPLKKFQETIIGDKVDVPNDKIWSDYCKGVS